MLLPVCMVHLLPSLTMDVHRRHPQTQSLSQSLPTRASSIPCDYSSPRARRVSNFLLSFLSQPSSSIGINPLAPIRTAHQPGRSSQQRKQVDPGQGGPSAATAGRQAVEGSTVHSAQPAFFFTSSSFLLLPSRLSSLHLVWCVSLLLLLLLLILPQPWWSLITHHPVCFRLVSGHLTHPTLLLSKLPHHPP